MTTGTQLATFRKILLIGPENESHYDLSNYRRIKMFKNVALLREESKVLTTKEMNALLLNNGENQLAGIR